MRYSRISVPKDVKAVLEKQKGDKEWGQYLLELFETSEAKKRRKALDKIRGLLDEEDYENIRRSSEEFRNRFKLR